jgi:hypothetical protein
MPGREVAKVKKDGLQRMLEFLDVLRSKGVHFRLERDRPETLMVTFTLEGICIEVEFFVDHIEFSYFKSGERGTRSQEVLRRLLKENWGD